MYTKSFIKRYKKQLVGEMDNKKFKKNTMIFHFVPKNICILFTVLVCTSIFIFSCTVTLARPTVVKNQKVDINDLAVRIKAEDTVLAGTRKTNLSDEKHRYSIIPLPYPNKNTDVLNLTLTLNSKTELNTKGFFLVNGYFSDVEIAIENIVQSDPQQDAVRNEEIVESNLYNSLNSFFNPQDDRISGTADMYNRMSKFSFKLEEAEDSKSLFSIAKAGQTGKEVYDTLVEINLNNTAVIPSQREFIFNYDLHGGVENRSCEYDEAKLYKKVEIDYAGATKHFAFWVDDTSYPDTDKRKLYDNIKKFVEMLYNTDNTKSLYYLLYKVNGSHIWGEHALGDATAASDSIINIAIGDINNDAVGGFVDPVLLLSAQAYRKNICREKKLEPTIYMSENLVMTAANLMDPTSFFSILVHEIQHVFTSYVRMIGASSSVADINNHIPKVWVNELMSVSMQYLLGYKISELMYPAAAATDLQVMQSYKKYFDNRYMNSIVSTSFVRSLFVASLTSDAKIVNGTYTIAFLLASYLVQNYGIEAIENLFRTTTKGRDALFQAVKNTTKYDRYGIYKPGNGEELLLAFFTSLFTADVIEDKTSDMSSPYKMFAPNPQSNSPIQFKRDGNLVYVEFEKYQYAGVPLYIPSINMSATSYRQPQSSIQFQITVNGVTKKEILDFNDLWTDGLGPRIFSPRYARYVDNRKIVMSSGQHSIMYLGGKIRKERKDPARSIGTGLYAGFFINDEDKLMLRLKLLKGSMSTLVIVEYL